MKEKEFKEIIENQQKIKEMLTKQNKSIIQKIWYTNEELMDLLQISRRTLSNWRDQGLIGFSQIGSKIYYNRSDVEKFMNQHYHEPFNLRRIA